MQALTRIRLVLFAVMIFGSFANFAQNEWGIALIVICQFSMAATFLWQVVQIYAQRIKQNQLKKFNWLQLFFVIINWLVLPVVELLTKTNQGTIVMACLILFLVNFLLLLTDSVVLMRRSKNGVPYIGNLFENYTLFLVFIILPIANLRIAGAALFALLTMVLFFIPFYFRSTIKLFNEHKLNKGIALLQSSVSLSVLLLGTAYLFKTMHYPGANIMMTMGLGLATLIFISGIVKRKYKYNQDNLNYFNALKLNRSHLILVYFALFIRGGYAFLVNVRVAPYYYEGHLPQVVMDLRNSGKKESADKSEEIAEVYFAFIENCKEKGFLQ